MEAAGEPVRRPMKATAGDLPEGEGWVHEIKWDGVRALLEIDDDTVTVWSSSGRDVSVTYPELAALGPAIGVGRALLDGEIVAFDDRGKPDFGTLQHRMHVASPRTAAERANVVPVTYFVFDLLELDGRSLLEVPLADRRRLLETLVEPGPHWRVTEQIEDGAALLEAAAANGLEGLVSKRVDSRYRPASRTREWRKVKVRRRQEFVVGGWTGGEGNRSATIGALLLGYHPAAGDPALRFAGKVGTGFTQAELVRLQAVLDPLAVDRCPFDPPPEAAIARTARWVRPEVVVEIEFAEWTGAEGGARLRHPSYTGQRNDKAAADVTAEP